MPHNPWGYGALSNVITLLFWQNTSCPSNMITYSWLTLRSKHIVCLAQYESTHWPHKALLAWEDELTTNKNKRLSISRPSTCCFLSYYQIRHLIMMTFMMTSSNGNIFRVTGHLCGEFTGPRWSPHTKASDAELWCFLKINGWVNNRKAGDLRRNRAHYDVIVMLFTCAISGWALTLLSTLAESGLKSTVTKWSTLSGPRFNKNMTSYQCRKSPCGDKTVVRSSYLHNGISYTCKMTFLYWIRALYVSHDDTWYGNHFRITVSLHRKSIGHLYIPLTNVQ